MKHRSACSTTLSEMVMVSESDPVVPETNTQSPSTTAREYPISRSNDEPDEIRRRIQVLIDFRLLGTIYYDRLDRNLRGFQFQAQLLLHRAEDRRAVAGLDPLRHPVQFKIEST